MASAQVSEEESDSSGDLDSDESSNKHVPGPKLTDGRYFQWQLNDGTAWADIDNDHVIEMNYSLPYTKGIKIYNTPYGVVSLDFNRMRVLNKDLKVRRLDDGRSEWIWYCILAKMWKHYGSTDAIGNRTPPSENIEEHFRENPSGCFSFSLGDKMYKIRFGGGKKEDKTSSPTTSLQAKARSSRIFSDRQIVKGTVSGLNKGVAEKW